MEYFVDAFSLDWRLTIVDFARVSIAFGLAIPIALERHGSDRNIGLRTYPIVAIASCGFVLIAKDLGGANAETHARLVQGIMTGIGFIGGGAILKQGATVRGLATAASIWCTGAIGTAVALEREEIAIVLSIMTFIVFRFLTPHARTKKEKAAAE
jgi:putative Mg2+ transporter-C (MgtC) family protein